MTTDAMTLAAAMCVSYLLAGFNMRACAQARYTWTAATDALIAAFGFYIIKRVASASTTEEFVAYTVGGVVGGACGIWLSKHAFGEHER